MKRRPDGLLVAALIIALVPAPAAGHASRTGYVEIRPSQGDRVELRWSFRTPLAVPQVMIPEGCAPLGPETPLGRILSCPGGIEGRQLRVEGLNTAIPEVLIRFIDEAGRSRTGLISRDHPAWTIPRAPRWIDVVRGYTLLGIEHIWRGPDHLLFVVALLALTAALRPLLATITAFTLGHSISLGLSALGLVHVVQAKAEVMIALSLWVTGAELMRRAGPSSREGSRGALTMAAAFGLIHGLGFATALRETGLSEAYLVSSLVGFNVGVELGQVAFVALALTAWLGAARFVGPRMSSRRLLERLVGGVVGGAGFAWMIERILLL